MKTHPLSLTVPTLHTVAAQPLWPAHAAARIAVPPDGAPLLAVADNVLQHKRLFFGLLLLALLAGLASLLLNPPQYRADTLLQIQPRNDRPLSLGLAPMQAESSAWPNGFVLGEIEILRSREILAKAVAATQADQSVSVANRFPLLGGWYARSFGAQGKGVPLDLPLLGGFAWGGESLRFDRLDVPRSQYGQPLTLAWQDPTWHLQDADGAELAQGQVGAPVSFAMDGQPALLLVN